jgi:hypothetical protein
VCGGTCLAQIIMGPHSIASYNIKRGVEDLFWPGSSRVPI